MKIRLKSILAYGLQGLHSVFSFILNAMVLYTLWRFGMPLHAAEGFGTGVALSLFSGLSVQLALFESFISASAWVSQAAYATLCFYVGKKALTWMWALGSACYRLLFTRNISGQNTSQLKHFVHPFSVHSIQTVFFDVAFMFQWMAGIAFLYALPISAPFAWTLYLLVIAVDTVCFTFGQGAIRYACDKYLDMPETGQLIVQLVYLPLRMWSLMYIPLPQVFLNAIFLLECVAPVLNWFATHLFRTLLSNKTVLEPKEAYVIHTLVHACLQVGRTVCTCAFLAYRFPVFLPMYWLPTALCLWLTQELAKTFTNASTANVSSSFFKQQMIFWKAVGVNLLQVTKWLCKNFTRARSSTVSGMPCTAASNINDQEQVTGTHFPKSVPVAPSSNLPIVKVEGCLCDAALLSASAGKYPVYRAEVATGGAEATVKQPQQVFDSLALPVALIADEDGYAPMHVGAKSEDHLLKNHEVYPSLRAAITATSPRSPSGKKGPCLRRIVGATSSKRKKRSNKENLCNRISNHAANACTEQGMFVNRSTCSPSPLLGIDQQVGSRVQGRTHTPGTPIGKRCMDPYASHASSDESFTNANTQNNCAFSPGIDSAYVPFEPFPYSR